MRQYEAVWETLDPGPWRLEGCVMIYTVAAQLSAPRHRHHHPNIILSIPYYKGKLMFICNFLMANMIIQSTISITGYMNFFQENRDPLFIHFYLSSSIHPPYVNLIGDFAPCEEQWGNLSCCFSAGYYQDDVCFLRSLNLSKPLSFVYVYHKLKWPVNFASWDLSLHPIIPK